MPDKDWRSQKKQWKRWRGQGSWGEEWPKEWGDHKGWDHRGWRDRPSNRKGGALFLRFVAIFGFIVLLFLGGLALAAYLLNRFFGGDGQMAVLVWILGCGLAVALPILAIALAARAFRGIATPLAGVMAAADAVAEGDLSARVPESGPGDFRRLAHSFNRMTGELERAEQQRRNLTADVAHELRTPLHIIQGNLEGMADGVYEPSESHLEATLEETRLLARLVEDLQTLSLAEAGQLALNEEPVNVAELLADVGISFSGQAEAAEIALAVSTEGDATGLTVWADYGRLDQVLGNLMANALRYTPPGGTIRLGAANRAEKVIITVADTGEGIPAEDLPYIFDRFWRGDRSRPHGGGSSGLGLAIAQQLVRAHHGRIEVTSEAGQGTTFTIELPAAGGKA
jgi:signal transduction histidine kinase